MLGSSKPKKVNTKLLDNLIATQKKLSAALSNARTMSESNGLAISAWSTPGGPQAMQKTIVLTRALASGGAALDDYTVSVTRFTEGLEALISKEKAVAEVVRDRDILISRLVQLTKKKPKNGREDKRLKQLAETQQELAACEMVLAAEQNALCQARQQTLDQHAQSRLFALHLFGAQAQQAAAQGLQQLGQLIGYAAAPGAPQSITQPGAPYQAQSAPSITQSYANAQRGAPVNSVAVAQYPERPDSTALNPESVYEAAPSYKSANTHSCLRDGPTPSGVAPVPETNETIPDGSSVFDRSTDVGQLEPETVESGELGEGGTAAPRPAAVDHSAQSPVIRSPEQAAEVGVLSASGPVPTSTNALGLTSRPVPVPGTRESSQPIAPVVAPSADAPVSSERGSVTDVYLTPTEEFLPEEVAVDEYSSSDPDENAVLHQGPYAEGVSRRPSSQPNLPVVQPGNVLPKARGTRRVSHRKHASDPSTQSDVVGPDGAIDVVGNAVAPGALNTAGQVGQDDAYKSSSPSKMSRHLSLMDNKKHHEHTQGPPDNGHNFLSRLNSVLKTDITVAAAEANHEVLSDEDKRGVSIHRSHSSSSGKQRLKRSSRTSKMGNSVLPEEDSDEEVTRPVQSTWQTRTDRNVRELGAREDVPGRNGTSKPRRSSGLGTPPLDNTYTYGSPKVHPQTPTRKPRTVLDSPASTEPRTPGASGLDSPALGTNVLQGTPVVRRKPLTTDSTLNKHGTWSQPQSGVTGLGLQPAFNPDESGDPSWYPAQQAYEPMRVKKVNGVRKSKSSSKRTSKPAPKGHTYETVQSSSSHPATGPRAGPYHVSAPQ